jgi:GNAT superfamily N-acetyltransferase
MNSIEYQQHKTLVSQQVIDLYASMDWSSAQKPDLLLKALEHSHTVITAWEGDRLIGLGNAISDGYLVVYYPHLVVHPNYQRRGIGAEIVKRLQEKYAGFHQQSIIADGQAIDFYRKMGFARAGACQALWIYQGHDHD